MPHLQELPLDVFGVIINYVNPDRRTLASWCLINSAWRQVLSQRLYADFTFWGDQHEWKVLWQFVRTILSSTVLAALVHTIDIRSLSHWDHTLRPRDTRIELSTDDKKAIRSALRRAGLIDMKLEFFKAVRRGRCEAFVALALTHLPHLTTLHALLPESDPFLTRVFHHAIHHVPVDDEAGEAIPVPACRAFQNLTSAYLASEGHYDRLFHGCGIPRPPDDPRYILDLATVWPIFFVPQLQTLCLYECNPGSVDGWLTTHRQRSSTLTRLTLVVHHTACLTETWKLLQIPTMLRSLSLCLPWKGEYGPTSIPRLRRDLWPALEPHRRRLRHLDVYVPCAGLGDDDDFSDPSHPLRRYRKLRSLALAPEILLGFYADERRPACLTTHLPWSLRSLTLYQNHRALPGGALDYSSDETTAPHLIDMDAQLTPILRSRRCRLTTLVIADSAYRLWRAYRDSDREVLCSVFGATRALCADLGVAFEVHPVREPGRGGQGSAFGRSCEDAREEVERAWIDELDRKAEREEDTWVFVDDSKIPAEYRRRDRSW